MKKKAPPDARALLGQIDAQLEARLDLLAVKKLSWFVRRVWPVVEPDDPLVWGPHIDLVCDEIERQLFGGDAAPQNLMLLMPPGSLKSWLTSVARPAWVWLHESSRRSWYVSASDNLTKRDSRRTRMILESETYKRLRRLAEKMVSPERPCETCGRTSHPMWDFAEDQNEKQNFETTNRGSRWCMPFGARGSTGNRARDFVFDDLIDIKTFNELSADGQREMLRAVNDGMAYIEATRATNLRKATRILDMQRVSDGDPADLRIKDGNWRVVCLPMEYDPEHPQRYEKDWRTEAGEWLIPGMFAAQEREYVVGRIGSHGYATQYQQRATAKQGGLVDRSWLGLSYVETPREAAASCDVVELWIDSAVKGGTGNDDCGVLVVGKRGGEALAVDDLTGKMGWAKLKETYRAARRKWPMVRTVVIEDKGSGSQLKEEMDAEGYTGNVLSNPGKFSKAQRWDMFARAWFEGRTVRYPMGEPWVEPHRAEVEAFTGRPGGLDNRVDCWSMGLKRWGERQVTTLLPMAEGQAWLNTGTVRRWSRRDPQGGCRMGVWVDWTLDGSTATWATVLDDATGEERATVRVTEGGDAAAVVVIAEEAAYWGATVRVGSSRPGLALRFTQQVARRGVRVAGRAGSLSDGERFVWGDRTRTTLVGLLLRLAGDNKVTVRAPEWAGEWAVLDPEDPPGSLAALALARVGLTEKAPKSVTGPKLVLLNKSESPDLWTRTANGRR